MSARFNATLIAIGSTPEVLLCTGLVDLSYGGKTYLARHPTLGALTGVGQIAKGLTGEVPRTQLSIGGASVAGLAWLTDEARLAQAVTIYKGLWDEATGALSAVSVEMVGELGQIETLIGDPITATLPVLSFLNRGFEPREGWNYNNATQTRLWPGDLGLGFVVIGGERVYPAAVDVSRPGSGGFGGGGFDLSNIRVLD